MRVTNINLTDRLLRNIQEAQKAQLDAQEQVATNQKISKPSDDGVKFGRVVKLESEKRELIQYKRNNGHAEDIINASILNLEKLQEINVRAMEIARIGASGVNQNSYSAYVEEVDQLLEEAINRANASFQGNYLFSGSKITTQPFSVTRGGTGATASPTIAGNAITAISLTNTGSEYSEAPTVTVIDSTGTGASATAVLNGAVKNIAVVEGGANYSSPTVTIAAPANTWAASTSYSKGDRIMVGNNIYRATNDGTSGTAGPTHNTGAGTGTGGGVTWQFVTTGSTATATASVSNGVITGYTITSAGSGYSTPPAATITDAAGTGAVAGTDIRGSIAEVIVDSSGSGYSASTTVSISNENQIISANYAGDTTKSEFYIGDGVKLSAHLDPSNNTSFLTSINNLMELRNALAGDAANVPGRMKEVERDLQTYEDSVLGHLSELSGKQLSARSSTDFESQLFLQKETQISNDVDIDLAEAMVKLTRAQTAYTIALQTSSGLLGNSLLDYI